MNADLGDKGNTVVIAERNAGAIKASVHEPRAGAMGGADDDAHRAHSAKGLSTGFQRRVHTLFVEAVRAAGLDGVTIRKIGRLLGVSDKTVSSWVQDGREVVIPATRFLELFAREDILPDLVRERFWRALGAEAGFYCVPIPEVCLKGGGGKVERELCDVVEEIGLVAGRVKTAMADGKLSREERDGLLEEVGVLGVQVVELAHSVRTHGLK